MSPAKEIGMRVRTIREQRGLSQAALAQQAGISREHVTRLEAGQHDATVSTLEALAKVLRIKVTTLLK